MSPSLEMPIMGLGTYALDYDTCVSSVKALLQNGGRLIDTAYMYGNEDAVGEGVRQAMEEYGIPQGIYRSRVSCGRWAHAMRYCRNNQSLAFYIGR